MIPLADQTFATSRSLPASYVGPALGYKGAIRALNAATERILIRRTFRNIGPTTPPPLSAKVIVTDETISLPDDLVGLPPPELASRELDITLALPPADLAVRRVLPAAGPQVENISTLPLPPSSAARHPPISFAHPSTVDVGPSPNIDSDGFLPVISKKKRTNPLTIRTATRALKQQLCTSSSSQLTPVLASLPADLLATTKGTSLRLSSPSLPPASFYNKRPKAVRTSPHKKRSSRQQSPRPAHDPYRRIYTHVRTSPYTANFTCCSASYTPSPAERYNPLSQRMPRNHAQALMRPDSDRWQEAETNEFNSFRENDLLHALPDDFDISTIPKHLIYDLTVLYDIKTTPQGTIDKYKVRAALRGDKYVNANKAPLYACDC